MGRRIGTYGADELDELLPPIGAAGAGGEDLTTVAAAQRNNSLISGNAEALKDVQLTLSCRS